MVFDKNNIVKMCFTILVKTVILNYKRHNSSLKTCFEVYAMIKNSLKNIINIVK